MRYWWVSQNKTWKQEINGGYMWSPKRNKGGGRSQYYDNMCQVVASDTVFSYYKQELQDVGIVRESAVTSDRPSEFDSVGEPWDLEGWYVEVDWHPLPNPLRPTEYINQLRPLLPEKYSPLHPESGHGRQQYLTQLPEPLAKLHVSLLGLDTVKEDLEKLDEDEITNERICDNVEEQAKSDTTISETEREAIVKARRGQGKFPADVCSIEPRCRVTDVSDVRAILYLTNHRAQA